MRTVALIRPTGVLTAILGLFLWLTAVAVPRQALGSVLMTIGVPISVDPRSPSVHRYSSIIFLTWSLLCVSAASSGMVCVAIGALLFNLGAMLLVDSSEDMRCGVGIVIITFGALLKVDPGGSLRLDPDGGLAKSLGNIIIAIGSTLCLAARRSDRRALTTGYWIIVTLRWIDHNFVTSWWKVGAWLIFLHEAFPNHSRKIIRVLTLPIQAMLLPIVFLYESLSSRLSDPVVMDRADSLEQKKDGESDQFPKLVRIYKFLAEAFRRIDQFLYPESSVHHLAKEHERTLGTLRRLGCVAMYGLIWTALALMDVGWTPLFLEIIPRAYTWSNSFVYSSIDSAKPNIRLLYLAPGTAQDALRGDLVENNVHNAHFEALSYAWGSHYTLRRRILINGRMFWIADSVAEALRSLRLRNQARALWIDQICINQFNNEEKSDQVGNKMRLVFQNAQRVIICLGRPAPHLAEAYKELESARGALAIDDRLGAIDRTLVWNSIAAFKATWENLLRRKWWSRVWIVQEALLNDNTVIRCGEHELAWESLADFSTVPEATCKVEPATRELLLFSQDYKAGRTADMDIVDLSIRFRKSNSSITHDRIYAFYGLSPQHKLPALRVDYDRTVMWVFADYTAHYIQRTQSLHVLALAETHGLAIPSWSVNFNFYAMWAPLIIFVDHLEASRLRPDKAVSDISPYYNASGGRIASNVEYEPDNRTLHLRGWYVDTVKDVACHVRESRFISSIKAWEDFARSQSMDWSKEKLSFIRTLLGDTEFDDLDNDWYDRCVHERYQQRSQYNHTRPPKDYIDVFWNLCTNRRLFVTERGSFGIGPAETEPGDYVCVFEGSRVPYILRRKGGNGEESARDRVSAPNFEHACKFIGEAVVRGIMYASKESLLEDEEAGRIQVRKISLD